MQLKSSLVAASVVLSGLCFAGSTYYVDPVKGNDSADGSQTHPRKTLVGVMELVTANAGDVVYAAPGTYNERTVTIDGVAYRVSIPEGTKLISTGTRENTFLVGAADTTSATTWNGCGPNAVRCGYLAANTEICGFTVTGGRDTSATTSSDLLPAGLYCPGNEYSTSTSYARNCIFSNLVTYAHGAAIRHIIACSCYFNDVTAGANIAASFQVGDAYNCVFGKTANTYHTYYSCNLYNCTFVGYGPRSAKVYNSILLSKDQDYCTMYNCLLTYDPNTHSSTNGTCRLVTAADVNYDPITFSPLPGSLAIDAGDNSYVKPSLDDPYTDYMGRARVYNGIVDVGAVEKHPSVDIDDVTGLDVTGLTGGSTVIPAGGIHATIKRNYKTALKVKGIRINGGELFEFEGDGADCIWEGDFEAGEAATIEVVYVDKNDWYVDAVNGNDANDGYTWYRARKTLAKAMALSNLKSGEIVHAAAGSYDAGEMWQPDGDDGYRGSNRVVVVAGVGLVATNAEKTLIVGRKPTNTSNKLDAIRCVFLNDGSWVENFTITNGFNYGAWGGTWTGYGGGVCLAQTATDGAAVGCRIIGCNAISSPLVQGATLIRCACVDTLADGTYNQINGCKAVIDSVTLDGGYVRNASLILNSLLYGVGGSTIYNSYVYYDVSGSQFYTCRTFYDYQSRAKDSGTISGLTVPSFGHAAPYRPERTDATYCDTGNRSYYENLFPARWSRFKGKDCTGGQRIYNAKIDIGAGEADWRDVYAAALAAKKVTVAEAGYGVTAGTKALNLEDGDSLVLRLETSCSGEASVKVVTTGTVTISCAGKVGTKDGDVYRVRVPQGIADVTITVSGATAVVSDIQHPRGGIVVIFQSKGS